MAPYSASVNWTQLRKQILDDYNAAIGHIDWLEAYQKRIANNGQSVMEDIDRAAKTEAANGKNKAAIINEAIKMTRSDFSTDDLIAFGEENAHDYKEPLGGGEQCTGRARAGDSRSANAD